MKSIRTKRDREKNQDKDAIGHRLILNHTSKVANIVPFFLNAFDFGVKRFRKNYYILNTVLQICRYGSGSADPFRVITDPDQNPGPDPALDPT